ncbi:MAG: T9SS type A sorting domain-containing protein [Saprospiraceae bacterium]
MRKVQKINSIIFCFLMLLISFNANSQLATTGSETVANTTIASNQQHPAIGIDSSGTYILVWESQGQDDDDDEDTYDGYGIYRVSYNSDGTVAKSETLVNSTEEEDQRFPDVAMNASGEAVVVWQSYDQDGDNWGIYRRKINSNFSNSSNQSKVNSTVTGRQSMPKVGIDDDFNYIIVWESEGDIYGRLYGDGGGTSISEFQINTTTSNVQNYPDVAMNEDGTFVVVWQSYDQDGDGFGIYHQRYNASGVAQGSETLVNTTTSKQQTTPSIDMDSTGNYIITWTDNNADGSAEGIFGQLYNADGTTNGNEFQINTTTSNSQDNAKVAMSVNGGFSVVWNSYAQDGENMGVYNQSYYSDGTISGAEIQVNTTTNYFQQFPAIALWHEEEAVIVWQDGQIDSTNSLDTDGYGVVFQQYNAAALPVELLYFYAEKQNENVRLDWQTATEINNSHFDVEWSTDGISFEKIGQVQGAGSTNSIRFYDFLHTSPALGFNYYRLKQVDFDGKYEYSDILNIEFQTRNIEYRIFPNPASSFITIENVEAGEVIQIFSVNGQFVKTLHCNVSTAIIDISNLPKGTYFIKIGTTVKRILIQ